MYAQYKLYSLRPANDQLPYYYYMISLGSFMGSLLAVWIVPLITVTFLEYFLGLLMIAAAFYVESPSRLKWIDLAFMACLVIALWIWPEAFPVYGISPQALLLFLIILIFIRLNVRSMALLLGIIMMISILPALEGQWSPAALNLPATKLLRHQYRL